MIDSTVPRSIVTDTIVSKARGFADWRALNQEVTSSLANERHATVLRLLLLLSERLDTIEAQLPDEYWSAQVGADLGDLSRRLKAVEGGLR